MAAKFRASPELAAAFASHHAADGSADGDALLAYRVCIVDETFALLQTTTFSEPAQFAPSTLVGDEGGACYMLVQQPSRKQWTIVSYVPDTSRVKDRMLYASGCARSTGARAPCLCAVLRGRV
jgi:hypothetical protein